MIRERALEKNVVRARKLEKNWLGSVSLKKTVVRERELEKMRLESVSSKKTPVVRERELMTQCPMPRVGSRTPEVSEKENKSS